MKSKFINRKFYNFTVILISVLTLILLGVFIHPPFMDAKTKQKSPTPAKTPAKPSTPTKTQSITVRYDQVAYDLSGIRELKFKNKVAHSVKDRVFLKKFLQDAFKKEFPPAKEHSFEVSLKLFGFVPQNYKVMDSLLKMYTEQVAGLYDFETRSLYLMEGGTDVQGMDREMAMLNQMGISIDDLLLIHELQHALQDQHFNLTKIIKIVESKNNDDFEYAVQSLIEGDAYIVMMDYMFVKMGDYFESYALKSGTPGGAEFYKQMFGNMDYSQLREMMGDAPMGANAEEFSKAPLFFKRTMLFPYMDGMVFVDGLRKVGGWEKVNQAFTKFPKSTEHILHVEKYLQEDNPVIIQWDQLSKTLQEWKMTEQNVLGEFITRTLFENFLPSSDFKTTAEGWGGDRYRIYEKGSQNFLVWYTSWDTQGDAKEFLTQYVSLLKVKYPAIKWEKTVQGKSYKGIVSGNICYAEIRDKDVLVMEKVPANLFATIVQQGWKVNKTIWK